MNVNEDLASLLRTENLLTTFNPVAALEPTAAKSYKLDVTLINPFMTLSRFLRNDLNIVRAEGEYDVDN